MFYPSYLTEIKLSLSFGRRNGFSITEERKTQGGLKSFESIKQNEIAKYIKQNQ